MGLVLTSEAGPNSYLKFIDGLGNEVSFNVQDMMLSRFTAEDDRFIGAINPQGIKGFSFYRFDDRRNPVGIINLDHVQYGLHVPEPSAFLLASLAISCYPGRGYCWA